MLEKAVEKLQAACEQWFTFDAILTHHLELARAALIRQQSR
jgi:hypothetical protein